MKKKRAPAPPPAPPPDYSPAPAALAALAAALALGAFLAFGFIRSASPTYDEPVHLASGYSYLKSGRYFLNILDHPPLAEKWAALPLLFQNVATMTGHPDFAAGRLYAFSDRFLHQNGVRPGAMLGSARGFTFATMGGLLAAALFLWGRRVSGPAAGAGAVWAAALTPVLLSNLALVTTDGMPAVMYFCVAALLSRRARPGWVWAAAGTAAGAALASKFSMASLLLFVPALLAGEVFADGERRDGLGRAAGLAVFLAAAAFVVAAAYGFKAAPLWAKGLEATTSRLAQGRSSYLFGVHSTQGRLLYFPAALLVKTPLPLLALAAWGAVRAWRRPAERLWLLGPAALFFLLALTAKVQIGVRHLLPVFPFLALWTGLAAEDLWGRGGRARAALAAFLLWGLVSVGRVHPHHLAYFNEAAGGPENGWRWLADSNLDWGQDLPALAEDLRRLGNPPVYLAYFGVGDPALFGIRYAQAWPNWNVPRDGDAVDPAKESGKVYLAVSATNLVGVYIADHELFSWLTSRRPVATPGHSIFLYDLTLDAEGRLKLAKILHMSGHPGAPGLGRSLLLQ